VRRHLADIRNAIGAPEEAEELLGQAGVTQSNDHVTLTLFDVPISHKSGPEGPNPPIG
jgi:hypothetical protein